MTGAEYFLGVILLLLGLNFGFYEAKRGLTIGDMKQIFEWAAKKSKK